MNAPRMGVLKAICLSAALLGGVSAVITLGLADSAYAREGSGNAGGNGKGQGNGQGNGRGAGSETGSANAGERSESKGGKSAGGNSGERGGNGGSSFSGADRDDDTAPVSGEKSTKASKSAAGGKGNKLAQALGVHPSELGALNAANASSKALANAEPGSRVGRIAAYRDAVLAGQLLEAEYEAALAVRDALNEPDRSSAEISGLLETEQEEQKKALSDLGELQGALEDATEEEKEEIQGEIDALEKEIEARDTFIGDLNEELAAATEYEAAQDAVEDLEKQVEEQAALETSLLEAAANKPVNESVEEAVQHLLGIN